jgi:hypothetical protein
MEEDKKIEVNGEMISMQEFQEMQEDPKKKLKEVEPGKFKLLERLFG